ncbi:NAD(P)-dependent oxidoreductase [Actinomadura macrotermitis]|uniref:NAD(P)-binding domain-containing protein n=1 Tax=Actinomadura macrotermitis TaxID=2585200 RepID=A0A7K0BMF1_9ACTN|nr:NAD(P)H-binding protein [Actinomadura macrotermitis]MQY02359.1 hypothetical protein [Actinomadura macrotermitis]
MKLTVLGATGGTGVQVVQRALDDGHQVTAIVRDPAKLPAGLRDRAEVVTADVRDAAALTPHVQGRDAVITALGTREGRAPTTICTDGARGLIEAMRAAGTSRLLLVSASGLAADSGDGPVTRYVFKPLLQRVLKENFTDLRRAEELVRASGLDWTIVRPPRLLNGPAKGAYRSTVDRNVRGGRTIRRADLAAALLDLAPGTGNVGHVVCVAG